MLYTHYSVDLDAACSIWAARTFLDRTDPIQFVPANWNGDELSEFDLALDIEAGLKGEKLPDGRILSCFSSLVAANATEEDQEALVDLLRFVDLQDSSGDPYANLGEGSTLSPEDHKMLKSCGLNSVLMALKRIYDRDDEAIVNAFGDILDGLYESSLSLVRAQTEAANAIVVDSVVAICDNNREFSTNGVVFETTGVKAIVYIDGYNLGVVRSGSFTGTIFGDNAKALVGDEDGWFIHSAGFLAARGSRKSEATSPSRVNPRDLAEAVAKDVLN